MDLKNKTTEELNTRMNDIKVSIELPDADLDALESEIRAIKEELESRKAAEEKRAELRKTAGEFGKVVKDFKAEEKHEPTEDEIRASSEYAEAYKNYIITGNDKECRALLSANASGQVPVPTILEEGIRTAWENDPIMSRVKRTFVRGNLKVAFELSATGAAVHEEGEDAPDEEVITIGIVEMVPANIKKWITISDEAVAMGGEAFLRYIYDEITYQIVRKAVAEGINDIVTAPAANGAAAVGVPAITAAPSITTIPTAEAQLSEEATNVVVVMNRQSEVKFIEAYAAGNFAIDPFAGVPRLYTSALPAYDTASAGDVYAIVGDLSALQFNYPEGDDIVIKWDDLSLAEKDLVKVVGRQYAAHAVTAPGRLVNVKKPS